MTQRHSRSLDLDLLVVRLISLVLMAVLWTPLTPAKAQSTQTLRIVAVVNDDVISEYDLGNRIGLVIAMSNLPRRADVARQLAPQVLRGLIDETLRLQDAMELEIDPSSEEIDRALSNMARLNQSTPGQIMDMLNRRNIDTDTLINQLRADVAWARTLYRRYGDRLEVSQGEIDLARKEIEASLGKPEYLVSEIFLSENKETPAGEVRRQAQRLVQQVRNGASFPGLAQSFSDLPTAANGGQLGWVRPDQLPSEVASVVASMAPNSVSDPIPVTGGIYIVGLRESRIAGQQVTGDATVTLTQFHVAVPPETPDSSVRELMTSARQRVAGAPSCDAFNAIAKDAGSPVSGSLGTLALNRLPGPIRNAIGPLGVGEISEPIRSPDAIIIMMVCDRTEPEVSIAEVNPDQIREGIVNQRINNLGRQRLRKLRRSAFIDVRL